MADRPKPSNGAKAGEEIVALSAQLRYLKWVVVLLVLMGLVVSVSFNMYLVRENGVTKAQLDSCRWQLQNYLEMHQFLQRLVGDMRRVARTDEPVAKLLTKYRDVLDAYKLGSQAYNAPE
jgi:hypothetical protein